MALVESISVTEFKAKCVDILERIGRGELERVTVTKRGKVVAVVTPPETDVSRVRRIHGFMRGSVVNLDDVDLTAPIVGESFGAKTGKEHG